MLTVRSARLDDVSRRSLGEGGSLGEVGRSDPTVAASVATVQDLSVFKNNPDI